MKMTFYKYEGAGNDFIIMDNRTGSIVLTSEQIAHLCHRRFGIGADGLMLLEHSETTAFQMVYYNADGRESTFCGNGGRCIAHYACCVLQMTGREMDFMAVDGRHHATIKEDNRVALTMQPVKEPYFGDNHVELNTGSPHYVTFVTDLDHYPVVAEGRRIRQLPQYQPQGINVNFLETKDGNNYLRTYERGVEDETLACGTGITAAAIALAGMKTGHCSIPIISKAGHHFLVDFDQIPGQPTDNIVLNGPVKQVFKGEVEAPGIGGA